MNGRLRQSSLLYAMPSFASGMARGVDLFGSFDSYNVSGSDESADAAAIAQDWRVLGDDMRSAMGSTAGA